MNEKIHDEAKTLQTLSQITIYSCELEKTKKFQNMFTTLQTYKLSKGKNYTKEVQCDFKGKFILYENDYHLHQKFGTVLARNENSFLKLMPSNSPIKLMLYVYVIRATIFGSLNKKEACRSYLSTRIGEKWHFDTENHRLNTLTPIFGR